MTSDLSYLTTGIFTVILPNTKEGEHVWREIVAQEGTHKIFTIHLKAVISQIRKAGYTIVKAKPMKMSDDELLAELMA